MYRANIDAVTAYFARRSTDPQTVADLTADTFVEAITSYTTFDPRRGTARAWLFGIARRVFAKHCESDARRRERAVRLAGRRELAASTRSRSRPRPCRRTTPCWSPSASTAAFSTSPWC